MVFGSSDSDISSKDEITSHSSKITNDRINEILKRMDYFCEAAWFRPTRDNLTGYYSSLKNLYNCILPMIDDEEFKKLLSKWPVIYYNLQRIEKDSLKVGGWDWKVKSERLEKSSYLKSQTLNDLDTIHQSLIMAMQQKAYFFRTDDIPIKGAAARLKVILERRNVMGTTSLENE